MSIIDLVLAGKERLRHGMKAAARMRRMVLHGHGSHWQWPGVGRPRWEVVCVEHGQTMSDIHADIGPLMVHYWIRHPV